MSAIAPSAKPSPTLRRVETRPTEPRQVSSTPATEPETLAKAGTPAPSLLSYLANGLFNFASYALPIFNVPGCIRRAEYIRENPGQSGFRDFCFTLAPFFVPGATHMEALFEHLPNKTLTLRG